MILQEIFTLDEAIKVLQKRRNKANNYILTDNTFVKDAINTCQGLPLAISMIGGLNLRSNEDWQDVIEIITKKNLQTEEIISDYDFNLYGTFQLSVNKLNQQDQRLFHSLAVFKAVKIPVQSIIALWGLQGISKDMVPTTLKKLNQLSLLEFIDSYRLVKITYCIDKS